LSGRSQRLVVAKQLIIMRFPKIFKGCDKIKDNEQYITDQIAN
jgi:hypothetical protein